MTQILSLIAWSSKTYDHQASAIHRAVFAGSCVLRWINSELEVVSGKVKSGSAFIFYTRTNGEKGVAYFENSADVNITTTGTKKVFIKIDQTKLDDGSTNAVDGSGIASIQTDTVYPSSNYVPLASITGGVITDARVFSDKFNQFKKEVWGVSSNGTDSYSITPSPAVRSLEVGQVIAFYVDVPNAGPCNVTVETILPDPLVIPIKKRVNVDPADGDIPAGAILVWRFDGTNLQMISQIANIPSVAIGTLAEYTDPDWDEWDIVEKPDGSQLKVKWATRRGLPKPPAAYAIWVRSPVMVIEWYSIASNKSVEQTNTAWGSQRIWYSTSERKASQLITFPTWYWKQLSKFSPRLKTSGSPTGNLTMKVYSDQWTTLLATSNPVAVATLSGSYSLIDFVFPNKEILTEWVQYYFTIETSQADSTSNYVEWGVSSTNLYGSGNAYAINSSGTYTLYGSSLDFAFELWTENSPWYVIKATKSTGFIGILKKAVSAFNEVCNIQPQGNVVGMDFGTETEVVSATVDLNQTSWTDVELQVYSGQGDQMFAFLTWPDVWNLTAFNVSIAQNGTGGGILTANVHDCTWYWASMATSGASLGSAVINSPTSGVNTFTLGSAIDIKPNTWYIIKFTSASGNSTNRWDIRGNNSSAGAGSNGTWDGARVHAYVWSAWQYNMAPYLVTRYTKKVNYAKGDFAYLWDTPGVLDTYRKANNPIPVGRIIDQTNLLLEKYSWGRLLWSASYGVNNTAYYRGSVPIPKNCSRVRVDIENGSNVFWSFDFNISEMGTDRTIRYFGGWTLVTATLNLTKNYIRALSPTGHTFTFYFYQ